MPAARPLCFCHRICSSTRTTTINYYWLRAERDSAPRLSAILKTEHIDIVIFMYRLSMVALPLVLLSSSTHALMLDNLPHHRDPSAAEDSQTANIRIKALDAAARSETESARRGELDGHSRLRGGLGAARASQRKQKYNADFLNIALTDGQRA